MHDSLTQLRLCHPPCFTPPNAHPSRCRMGCCCRPATAQLRQPGSRPPWGHAAAVRWEAALAAKTEPTGTHTRLLCAAMALGGRLVWVAAVPSHEDMPHTCHQWMRTCIHGRTYMALLLCRLGSKYWSVGGRPWPAATCLRKNGRWEGRPRGSSGLRWLRPWASRRCSSSTVGRRAALVGHCWLEGGLGATTASPAYVCEAR